jgi:two-component system LytT family sensor kinase
VKRYIDLQAMRFSDRLTVGYSVDRDCEACAVPTFVLQPLVENAFRHGIARRPGPCRLELAARVEGRLLHIWVNDDGAGLPPGFRIGDHAGVGLRNATSRLQTLFGEQGTLEIGPREHGGTSVHITLPARAHAAPSMEAAG